VLVCRKCSKKLDGGFGAKGRTPLAKALRKLVGLKKGRKARMGIIETGCLGLCPKGGVTVVDGAHPGEWMVVYPGADLDDLLRRLDGERGGGGLAAVSPVANPQQWN